MYEQYWGLREAPFAQTPDPRFLYLSPEHEDALMLLHYAVARNKGAAMLAGRIGLGKTTLSRKLLETLDAVSHRVVMIVNPVLTPVQMLREILSQLGVEVNSRDRQVLVQRLHLELLDNYDKGRKVVLLVDEAHLIRSSSTFEELRLLLNCQMNDQFLISLLLLGQEELVGKLKKVPALEQRLAVRHTLRPLTEAAAGEMLLHRLRVAGYAREEHPFDEEAIHNLHQFSDGAPRLILQMADNALLMAAARRLDRIRGEFAYEVAASHLGEAA
jgi:general secretion pathway protein A